MPKQAKKTMGAARPFTVGLSMDGTRAVIDVSGVIGWSMTSALFTDKVNEAKASGAKELLVRINSVGGYCYEGLAMGDCLRGCGMHTTGLVIGTAQSMASYLLQCCDVRQANEHATLMFHQPYGCVEGTVDEMRAEVDYLCSMRDAMFELMAQRCGMTGPELIAEHMTAKYYTGRQALDRGFLDALTGDAAGQPEVQEAPAEPDGQLPAARGGLYDTRASLMAAMLGDDQDDAGDQDEEDNQDGELMKRAEEPAKPKKPEEEQETPAGEPARKPEERADTAQSRGQCEMTGSAAMFTQAQLEQACRQAAQAAAQAAMASMGADPASLPAPVSGQAGGKAPSREQFAAMSGLEKLEMMQRYPELGQVH